MDGDGNLEVCVARRRALESYLDLWYKRKSEFWKQILRVKFVKDIDQNSKYLQSGATFKKRKKQLAKLQIKERSSKDSQQTKNEARKFFKLLYQIKNKLEFHIDEGFVNRISGMDAAMLETMQTVEEFKSKFWACDPSKAPGSDGFNLNFIWKM